MNVLQSMIIAFSMYSKLPMPHIAWQEKNMKYAMWFFPDGGYCDRNLRVCSGKLDLRAGLRCFCSFRHV